jgi:hypothetical protein
MRTYWSSIEFEYSEGAELYGKCKGGFVFAFVVAKDVRDALPRLQDEMHRNNRSVLEVEFVSPYEDVPWDSAEEEQNYEGLATEAAQTGNVVFDTIYAYEEK